MDYSTQIPHIDSISEQQPSFRGGLGARIFAAARAHPHLLAVEDGQKGLTYGELENAAGRLGQTLRNLGVYREKAVAIIEERSLEAVVAQVGILAAGGFFVPLVPALPAARLEFVLEDLHCVAALGRGPLAFSPACPFLSPLPAAAAPTPDAWGIPLAEPQQLAYAIYTSGSTGQSKAVGGLHAAAEAFFDELERHAPLAPGTRCAWTASPHFDVSIGEVFGALTRGATLVVAPETAKINAAAYVSWLVERQIEVAEMPAPFLVDFLELLRESGSPEGLRLRVLSVGTEPIPHAHLTEIQRRLPGLKIFNYYGPTETTVACTSYQVEARGDENPPGKTPIGRPGIGCRGYLVSPELELATGPTFVGELLIQGVVLSRGYLGRPALTAASFVPDPFSGESGSRLYRTGDRVQILPSGELEFLGRFDDQVKIRGYRIEPGEIASRLLGHPEIKEAAVIPVGEGENARLVACAAAIRPEAPPSPAELRRLLRENLPDYMIPADFRFWPELPKTLAGKVDRRALAAAAATSRVDDGSGIDDEPRTPVERELMTIWRELLAVPRVGRHDDFFQLGGHSLSGGRLLLRLQRHFGIELPPATLFEHPNLSALAKAIEDRLGEAPAAIQPTSNLAPAGLPHPLSPAQERLYFLYRFQPDSAAYNIPAAYHVEGRIDPDALQQALLDLEQRHAALRTRFQENDGIPHQVVVPAASSAFLREKLEPSAVDRRLAELARQPFDLAAENPWRCCLLELSGQRSVLFFSFHHAVFDGLSLMIFENELAAAYSARTRGLAPELPELRFSFTDLAVWQARRLDSRRLAEQIEYWRGRISVEPTELPTDFPRPAIPSFRGQLVQTSLDPALVARCEAVGRDQGATPFLAFLAPFLTLLSRLSGQNKVAVGAPFSGRNVEGSENLVGFFVNTLVLGATFDPTATWTSLVHQLRSEMAGALAHQDVPFDRLATELQPQKDPSRNPLFQVTFQLLEGDVNLPPWTGLEVGRQPVQTTTARFDLELMLERNQAGGIEIGASFATDLFEEKTVRRWLELYELLVREMATQPRGRLSDLTLQTPADRQLYKELNQNQTPFPREASLAEIFAQKAAAFPEQIALELREQKLTYRELDHLTNHLGWHLRHRGAGPGTMVGLCFERGLELPIAILAVVKTGAAYVPLDGDYPEARLRGMVEDTAMPMLLGSQTQIQRLPNLGIPTLTYESLIGAGLPPMGNPTAGHQAGPEPSGDGPSVSERSEFAKGRSEEGSGPAACPNEANPAQQRLPPTPGGLTPAVTIFTSGSTGKPKGVAVTQRAICRLVFETNYITLQPGDVIVQANTASFDAYTFEIWGAFLHGGTLLIIDRDTLLDPKSFAAALAERDIDALVLTVTLFTQMMLEEPQAFTRVRHLMFGGEACDPNIARRALEYPPAHLQNAYGPAECTTFATIFEVRELDEDAGSVPIGKPISNTEVLILDPCGRPAAVGVHGELCLGGDGLALGYWQRPALTARAFVPHPCSEQPGARLYRTGDLARLLPSGDFDYLGRIDFQVKVRGYRIELGEIEAVLGRHPAVREKIALTQGKGRDQRLIAFVTVQRDEADEPVVSAAELQRFCGETLPAFSVPLVHLLETMPITPNGKIDRKALPTLKADQLQGDSPRLVLRTETEKQVAAAFGEILGAEDLGGDADFFVLGGHSLLATRLMAALRRRCGVELPVRQLFTTPTVATLAASLDELRAAEPAAAPATALKIPQVPVLSFAQQRLYFLHRFNPESPAYNLPAAYRLRGPLDRGALETALAAIEERHEILRTRFRDENGEGWPVLLPPGPLTLALEELPPGRLHERLRELSELPFDLLTEKPWRHRLLRLKDDDHVLFIVVHHIAFDGLSLRIFENELAAFYAAACRGEKAELAPLPRTYADFAAWQRAWLQGVELERQLAFWRGRIHPEPLELPTDRPRPPVPSFRGGSLERTLSQDLVQKIETLGRQSGTTAFLAFLAPFQMLLARLSGQYQVNVGVPFSGRHQGDVEGLIGFFINTLVLSADLADDPTFETLLRRLREEFSQVFAHQDIPFEKLVEELGIARDPSRNPLYQVNFQLFEGDVGEAGIGPIGPIGRIGPIEMESLDVELRVAKFDMEWLLERTLKGELRISAWYATDLFEEATVAGWLELYEVLLRGIAAAPGQKLSRLPLLRAADLALYAQVNNNHTAFPRNSNLIAEWNQRAAQHSELIACEYRGETLTYRELDERTSRLARRLLLEGVTPGSMVGVCIARSVEMVVAILAIVKTGSAYTPMDADYPVERLVGMVEDTRMPLLLAGEAQKAKLPEVGTRVLLLADVEAAAADLPAIPMPAEVAFPESAANVIFTSGSTGRPKGVVVTQRGVLRLVRNTNYMDLQPGDVVVQASSASFDVLTFELWGALMNGGRLLVIDRDTLLQPKLFAAAIQDRDIAALFLTVTLFSQMVLEQPRAFVRVRHLFFGGEACEPSIVRRALENPPAHLQNGYGPTECTCYANVYEVKGLQNDARSVPIGPPISNTEALILDRCGQIASIGVHGELCLGGDGLAWGYWRRPQLTAQTFVAHPNPRTPGERLYRTGDLARLLPSGDFDYLGRIDFQVKVRGFRIELGEIEALLGRHPAVREKIALTRGQGADQLLVAFVVVQTHPNGEPAVSAAELQRYCAEHLPAFAVPVVRVLDQMPTTPNGKIDRKALPSENLFANEERASEPPRDAFEKLIAETWAEVLTVPLPGRDADFFALGGHSLAAMRIISALTSSLGIELPLPLLFGHSNLAAFAAAARATLAESEEGRELLAALDELDNLSEEQRQNLASS